MRFSSIFLFRVLNPNCGILFLSLFFSSLFSLYKECSRASSFRETKKDFIIVGKILRFKKNNRGGDFHHHLQDRSDLKNNIESSVVQNNSSSSSSFGTGGGGGKERKKMMTTISSRVMMKMWNKRLYCRISTSNGEETLERVFEKEEASFLLF